MLELEETDEDGMEMRDDGVDRLRFVVARLRITSVKGSGIGRNNEC